EFTMVRELGDVVRGWRRGAAEPVGRVAERRDQARARLAVVGLEDARFVEDDPGVVARRDLVEPLIVDNLNPRTAAPGRDTDPNPGSFGNGLRPNEKRRENKDTSRNIRGPSDLHPRLAETGV